MNREIKFRAKENIHNKFVYSNGYYFDGINYWFLLPSENTALAFTKKVIIDFNTLSQYTGLKDSYGRDIYEGDILAFEDEKEFKWLVKYNYDSFIAKGGEHNQEEGLIEFYDWNRERLDVIVLGNIYENTNLLKEDENERN